MCPSVSVKVSEMVGGAAVLARSIPHHAEFVKPPSPKKPIRTPNHSEPL